MNKIYKKILSVFIITLLTLTTCTNFFGTDTVSAATEDSITIYYDNSYTNWDKVSIYYWGDASNQWPGEEMTKNDSGKFEVQIPKGANNIIFNNNGQGEQSVDISNISDNDEYVGIQTIGGKVLMIKKVNGNIPTPPTDGDTTPKQVNTHVGNDYSKVNLTYTTEGPCDTKVNLKDSNGNPINTYDGSSEFTYLSFKFNHTATLSNLKPETVYNYTIESGNKIVNGSFKTTSDSNSTSSAKFAFLADCQINSDTDAKAFGATCSKLNSIPDLDLVYIAGDITNNAGNEKQYEALFNNGGKYQDECQKMFSTHLLSITQGNHDVSDFSGHITVPSASAEVGDDVYSYNIGNARFIVLNLETAKNNDQIREAQKQYLINQVADAKSKNNWVIVSFHKSLYTGASHIVDSDIVAARKYWSKTLSDLNVDMVLEGHDHVYARGFVTEKGENANLTKNEDGSYNQHDGSPLYMVGGHAGGLKWYDKKDYTVDDSADPLSLNYSFLDINSADPQYNADGLTSSEKKEQFYTIFEVTENKISSKTYTLKYNTDTDSLDKEPTLYDEVTLVRKTSDDNTPNTPDGTSNDKPTSNDNNNNNSNNDASSNQPTNTNTDTPSSDNGTMAKTSDSTNYIVVISCLALGILLMVISKKIKVVNK